MSIISELSNFYGVEFIENPKSYVSKCPFCESRGKSSDDKKCFYVYKDNFFVKCHKCEYRNYYKKSIDIDTFDLLDYYKNKSSIKTENEIKCKTKQYSLINKNSKAYKYLLSRKFTDELIEFYRLRYDDENNSIAIPIIENNIVVDYLYRYINHPFLRYKFNINFKKSDYVYNIDSVVNSEYAVLCEGVISAMFADKDKKGIATFGKNISKNQLNKLYNTSIKKIYVAYEWDFIDNLENTCQILSENFNVFVCSMPFTISKFIQYGDPNDSIEFDFRNCFQFNMSNFNRFKTSLFSLKLKNGVKL